MKKLVLLIGLTTCFTYAQTNIFPDSGNVGIGTVSPEEKLDVHGVIKVHRGSDRNSPSFIESEHDPRIWSTRNFGSEYGYPFSGADLGHLVLQPRTSALRDILFITGNGSNIRMVIKGNGNVGIGTTTPDAKLTVKGNIHTQEIKVDLAGAVAPDYVFKEGYPLRSLEEVQAHIKEKGHLPGIPSANEMEEDGINLKEMNLKLLEKVEELTLYTIEQQKEIKVLQQEIRQLKKK